MKAKRMPKFFSTVTLRKIAGHIMSQETRCSKSVDIHVSIPRMDNWDMLFNPSEGKVRLQTPGFSQSRFGSLNIAGKSCRRSEASPRSQEMWAKLNGASLKLDGLFKSSGN